MAPVLKTNSRLSEYIGEPGRNFLNYATGAIRRLLPHVEVSRWQEIPWQPPQATWTSSRKSEIRITVSVGDRDDPNSRSVTATVVRRRVAARGGMAADNIDVREHTLCNLVAQRISQVMSRQPDHDDGGASIRAIQSAFDEFVVAGFLQKHHGINVQISSILKALHTLSEQSYENKSLTFGCILDPQKKQSSESVSFPGDFLRTKKYKALSDGFRTAYVVSTEGAVVAFVDLERYGRKDLTEKNFYPDWCEPIARASRNGKCGISLSRQGDLLVFDEGTLRFTYRYGKWQYWNHTHLIKLLRDRARAQRVPSKVLGHVVGAIYRAALDVSFRRTGGLFVILHNKNHLRSIVRRGDAIADIERPPVDREFDSVFREHKIWTLPRSVTVELASLDGAVVLANSGQILAYGAVLQPAKKGKLRGTEGSRTKAAIGASNYGTAIKISSDGDISVFHDGSEFICV